MPYVFDRAANKRKRLRIHEKNKRKLNPCPGRPPHERQFIMRCMTQIGDAHAYWLDETDRAQELWLPSAHIDSRINEASSQMLPLWQDCTKDDDGYLLDTHNHNLKASNMITVGTWYRNEEQDLYAAFMPMLSPLPCDDWGALPLNLGHWRAAIAPMIEAHARWRWVHAVREYWKGDMTWNYGGTFGWRMETCKQIKKGKTIPCIGLAIYTHVLIKYSNRHQNRGQGT